MTSTEIYGLIVGAIQGIGVTAVFVLALFIGFTVLLTLTKLRPGGGKTLTVRTIDEAMGQAPHYLPPGAPRGTSDQLAGSRQSS